MSPKTVLIVQPSKHQAQVWYSALTSQGLAVISETANVDLMTMLSQMKAAKLNLPDLILLDLGANGISPYVFCRWCRDNYPNLKIVLTNAGQKVISEPEKDWAIYQGAQDLLPGFQRETLMTGVVEAVNRILAIMALPPVRQDKLIQTLFAITNPVSSGSSTNALVHSGLEPVPNPLPNMQPQVIQAQVTGPAGYTAPAPNANPSVNQDQKGEQTSPKRRYRGSSY